MIKRSPEELSKLELWAGWLALAGLPTPQARMTTSPLTHLMNEHFWGKDLHSSNHLWNVSNLQWHLRKWNGLKRNELSFLLSAPTKKICYWVCFNS